jgi:ribosomal protein S18 acetylase RimI-like enzyme
MRYRPYLPADRAACLDILASNLYRFFSPGDPDRYGDFLARLQGFYGVVEDGHGQVIGCGGYCIGGHVAVLTWGMVHAEFHRRGIGAFLLTERLHRIAQDPGVETVVMNTAQPALGFYVRMGFAVVEHTPDGYATGLDRYDLELTLERSA